MVGDLILEGFGVIYQIGGSIYLRRLKEQCVSSPEEFEGCVRDFTGVATFEVEGLIVNVPSVVNPRDRVN